MNNYTYKLEKYSGKSSRYECPKCHKQNQFTRYVDIETGESLSHDVGKCNRIDKCGYHYTPSEYFYNNNTAYLNNSEDSFSSNNTLPIVSCIDKEYLDATLSYYNYKDNNLTLFLDSIFGEDVTNHLINIYKIGTSSRYGGSTTVFWQIDSNDIIRTGKLIKYNLEGHRIKGCNNWVHTVLNLNNFHLEQCLFGEHLLKYDSNATVGIVESEKTAIIMTANMPNILWLASGGAEGINHKKVKILESRDVILFPDTSIDKRIYLKWEQKAKDFGFGISDYLEKYTTEKQKQEGADIADIIVSDIIASKYINNINFSLTK